MTIMRSIALLVVVTVVCIVAIPPATEADHLQDLQPKPPQMVMLHVRVTDASGKAVTDVPQSSFQVTENGVPQQIDLFMNKEIPLSYGLVIDNSGSLHDLIEKVVSASIRIVNSNLEADEAFLIRFISSDKIEIVQKPTSDKKLLVDGLNDLYIEGGATAVIDAVYLSAQMLAEVKSDVTKPRRKVLVLVTDGDERNSYYREKDLLKLLYANESQIYIVGLTQDLDSKKREKALRLLRLLAGETGGRLFLPASPAELDRIADEIINDIRTQYVLGYIPAKSAQDFHKVQVTIADNPNQEKRIAVTRVGYSTKSK